MNKFFLRSPAQALHGVGLSGFRFSLIPPSGTAEPPIPNVCRAPLGFFAFRRSVHQKQVLSEPLINANAYHR